MSHLVPLIVFAAMMVCGLLLLLRRANHRRWPHWSVGMLLALVAAILVFMADGWFAERDADRRASAILASMESDPVFSAIRASSPDNHRRIVEAISLAARASPELRERRVHDLVDPILQRHVRERQAGMDDAMTSRLAALVSDVVLERADADPAHCIPDTSDVSQRRFVTLMGRERATAFMVDLVRMTPASDARVARPAEISVAVAQLVPDISRRARLTEQQVVYGQVEGVQTSVTCRIMGGMLASLAALPPERGAPLIRGLSRL